MLYFADCINVPLTNANHETNDLVLHFAYEFPYTIYLLPTSPVLSSTPYASFYFVQSTTVMIHRTLKPVTFSCDFLGCRIFKYNTGVSHVFQTQVEPLVSNCSVLEFVDFLFSVRCLFSVPVWFVPHRGVHLPLTLEHNHLGRLRTEDAQGRQFRFFRRKKSHINVSEDVFKSGSTT